MIFLAIAGVAAAVGALGYGAYAAATRYEGDQEKIEEATEKLKEIESDITEIHDDVKTQIDIINSAVSGFEEYLNSVNENNSVVQEDINSLIGILDEQWQLIQEYNDASYLQRLTTTYTMMATNLFEGGVSVIEDIGDGVIMISATIASPFTDTTSLQLFAARDLTGEAFDYLYEDGFLKNIEKYSGFSHNSTAANIFKGIGTAGPYILLASTGVGFLSSMAADVTIAGISGFGRGSTDYAGEHLIYDANGNLAFDDEYSLGTAVGKGALEGGKDALLTAGMTQAFKVVGRAKASRLSEDVALLGKYGDDVANLPENAVKELQDDISTALQKADSAAGKTLKSPTEYAKEAEKYVEKLQNGKITQKELNMLDNNFADGAKGKGFKDVAQDNMAKSIKESEATRIRENPTAKERAQIREAGENSANHVSKKADATTKDITRSRGEAKEVQKLAGEKNIKNANQAQTQKIINESKDALGIGAKNKISSKLGIEGKNKSADTLGDDLIDKKRWSQADTKAVEEAMDGSNYSKLLDEKNALQSQIRTDEKVLNKSMDDIGVTRRNNDFYEPAPKNQSGTGPVIKDGSNTRFVQTHADEIQNIKDLHGNISQAETKLSDVKSALKDEGRSVQQAYLEQASGSNNLKARALDKIADSPTINKIKTISNDATSKLSNTKVGQLGGKALESGKNQVNKVLDVATGVIEKNPKATIGVAATVMGISNADSGTSYMKNVSTYVSPYESATPAGKAGVYESEYALNGEKIKIDEIDDLGIQGSDPATPPAPTNPGGGGNPTINAPDAPKIEGSSSTTDQGKGTNPGTTIPDESNNNDNNNNTQDDSTKKPDDKNETTNPTPTPNPSDKGSTVISNPPSNNNQGSSGVNHGGTYNNSGNNNNWNSGSTENNETELNPELNPELEPELPIEDPELPEDPIEEESVYTIPSNLSGVKENNKKTSSGSGVLPVLGGLGAAAAVGVGAKMYLDNKKNNENGDDEDYSEENDEDFNFSENNDLLADEWNGEDTEFNYEDPSGNNIAEPDDDLGEM